MKLEPFMLKSEYREYVWGGNRIRLNGVKTAEAWMVYEGNVIIDGQLKGKTLSQAAECEAEGLLGTVAVSQTGKRFPLLIKLLDCADWLSLQVHPNNAQAEFWEGTGHFGKTEAWYIVDAEEGAELISGFKLGTSKSAIKSAVGTTALLDIIEKKAVKKGDAILITPGTIHALGPGMIVYEVQQTSDITYRVYDWGRPKQAGRILHLKQAADVLNPHAGRDLVTAVKNQAKRERIITSEFFELCVLKNPKKEVYFDTKNSSFHCLTMIEGEGVITGEGWQRNLTRFETLVIPACCGSYRIHPGALTCLSAYVPD